jgi:hypothetical protein
MAISTAIVRHSVPGDVAQVVADITCDAAYPAGGYAITPATFGLSSIDFVHVSGARGSAGGATLGLVWEWDHVNSKLKAYRTGSAVNNELLETDNAKVSTATVLRVCVWGRR